MSQPSRRERLLSTALVVGGSEAFFGLVFVALPFVVNLPDPGRTVFLALGAVQILSGAAIVVFREKIVAFLDSRKGE
jgi:hypothetical protein